MNVTETPIVFSSVENALNLSLFLNNEDTTQSKPSAMKDLVDNTSVEWYRVGPNQTFIPVTALTQRGKEEYKKATERALTETPKNILEEVTFIPVSCGMWFPDKKSPHYSSDDMIFMCCMTDYILHGKVYGEVGEIQTSLIKWSGSIDEKLKWVITKNGSLYHYR